MNDVASKDPPRSHGFWSSMTIADMLRLLSMRLNSAGYRVSTAGSAESALAKLQIERPQLVLSDLRMPGQDGMALFERIRCASFAAGDHPDRARHHSRGRGSDGARRLQLPDQAVRGQGAADKVAQAMALRRAEPDGRPTRTRAGARSIITPLPAHGRPAGRGAARGRLGRERAHLRRERHRQGAAGAGDPPRQPARASAPFVAVNCGAIPEALLESELFGHEKGAFTGAVADRKGLFQAADGGTLFLDEIGDMPPAAAGEAAARAAGAQGAAGGLAAQSHPVDVRVISATHRDLEARMAPGEFREDLYYRLNVVTLTLPTLGERREDIPLLANHFLQRLAERYAQAALGLRARGDAGC